MYLSAELFQHSWEGYFGVYFPSCEYIMHTKSVVLFWYAKHFKVIKLVFIKLLQCEFSEIIGLIMKNIGMKYH